MVAKYRHPKRESAFTILRFIHEIPVFLVHRVFWCCAIGEYRERGCRGQGGQVKVRLDWKGMSGLVYISEKLGIG